jgi:hypothetical protein
MSKRRDFEEERDQREWEAQESGLRAERSGASSAGNGATSEYKLIARALRMPPIDALPADFAARTAACAERESRIANESVEIWLERGLVALLLLAGAVALRVYGDDSLFGLSFSVPERAAFGVQTVLSWSLAIAACVGLSSVFAAARKR